MASNKQFCCMDVKTCGMIVGVVGIIIGIIAGTYTWRMLYSIPWLIFFLATYIIILVGMRYNNTCCLLMAEIFLGFQIGVQVIIAIGILCFAIGANNSSSWIYGNTPRNDEYYIQFHYWLAISIIFLAVFVMFASSICIFSCVVVHQVRQLIEEENFYESQQYSMPQPVHVDLYGPHVVANIPSTPQQYPHLQTPVANDELSRISQEYSANHSLYPNISSLDTSSSHHSQ